MIVHQSGVEMILNHGYSHDCAPKTHSRALPGRVGCCSCELLATLSKFSIIQIYFYTLL